MTSGTQTTKTLYVGKLYEKRTSGFDTEHVNFIRAAGQVVATVTTEGFSDTVEYLHRDHLGSVVKVTDGSGAVIEGLSCDAFGKRRNADGTNDPGDSQYGVAHATTLSFTGHEQLDHIKLVHMNGRIYDPVIGRFLSPDPFVQFPESTQGLNRYTYVNNNPLSLTDPSGYFIGSLIGAVVTALFADDIAELLEDNWRTIAAVAIASAVPYAGLELGGSILAGFASGVVASGGDLEAGLIGAATAGAFHSVGSAYSADGAFGAPTSFGAKAGKVVLHGTVGGVSQELSGGKFGNGFLSAGFTQYAGQQGWIGGGAPASNVATSAMVGGTASALGGGKFANGAATAAFLQSAVEAADYYKSRVGYDADILPGTEYVRDADGNIIRYEGVTPPGPEYDVSGFNRNIEGHWLHPRNAFKQGGIVGRAVNYLLPFGKATSHLHDTWLNVNPSLSNVGTMLPAYAVSVGAVPGAALRGWQSNPMVWQAITQPRYRGYDDD